MSQFPRLKVISILIVWDTEPFEEEGKGGVLELLTSLFDPAAVTFIPRLRLLPADVERRCSSSTFRAAPGSPDPVREAEQLQERSSVRPQQPLLRRMKAWPRTG